MRLLQANQCWLLCLLFIGPVSSAYAKSVGLVVTGIGGNEAYSQQFLDQGQVISDALRTVSESADDIRLLQGVGATRESVLKALEQISRSDADTFFLILVGHGSVDSETWRFNLHGADISTEDFIAALAPITIPKQLLIVATSASGALLEIFDQPGRLLVTATKSAGEINAVRFPEYLAEALGSSVADIDRNEILTLAEVFRYTNDKTQRYYQEQNLLASEHAKFVGDDADRIALTRLGSLKLAKDNPVVSELLQKRLVLEDEFYDLKAQKSTMEMQAYYESLEPLLVSIAKLQMEIDAVTGWEGGNE